MKKFLVLGIETSCDDTSVAVLSSLGKILHLETKTQNHEEYGGVYPIKAMEYHKQNLPILIKNAPTKNIDYIAVTRGPGLAPCLNVGLQESKKLALELKKPLFGIHHMDAHALTARLTHKVEFPYLCLLCSGGHTLLVLTKNVSNHVILGKTLDDAAGEAFDKVSRMLGLKWTTGPAAALEELARQTTEMAEFPIPLLRKPKQNMDFSFSGLKTHALKLLNCNQKAKIALGFQSAVINHLKSRVLKALQIHDVKCVVCSGGVANNKELRKEFSKLPVPCIFPEGKLCSDNAAMIAWTAIERINQNYKSESLDMNFIPKWPIDTIY